MLFHVLGHVDADDVLLAVEQRLRQGLGQLRLADAGGPQEDEGADGPARVPDAAPRAQHGVRHQLNGLVLSDDPPVEDLVQLQELLPLPLQELRHRDTRPAADDIRDLVLRDLLAQEASGGVLPLLLRLAGLQLLLQLLQLAVAKLRHPVEVVLMLGPLDLGLHLVDLAAQLADAHDALLLRLVLGTEGVRFGAGLLQLLLQHLEALLGGRVLLALQGRFLDFKLHHAPAGRVQLGRQRVDLRPDHGTGLVHQVDGLVGQKAVRDVAVREDRCRHQRVVADAHAVVDLQLLADAAQDGDRVLHVGLLHGHGLEPPCQGRVLLDVLSVLIDGRRPDAVQLAPRQHGLQHVARVHGALCRTSPDDGVQLVDEQDDAPLALLHLVQDGLQPLLKLAAELGPGDQRPHVQGKDRPVLQSLRHISAHDALRQPLHDGRLTNSGVTDQHGVVLRLAAQDADDATHLLVTPDHRVQLPLPRRSHQVAPVLGEGLVGGFGVRALHPLRAADLRQRLQEAILRDAQAIQDAPQIGVRPLVQHRKEQVLDGNVLVFKRLRALLCGDKEPVEPRGHVDLSRLRPAARNARHTGYLVGNELLQHLGVHFHAAKHAWDQPLRVLQERQHKVLHVHLLVASGRRNVLRGRQGRLALRRQFIEVHTYNLPMKDIFLTLSSWLRGSQAP